VDWVIVGVRHPELRAYRIVSGVVTELQFT
jgi:hypothetical protein